MNYACKHVNIFRNEEEQTLIAYQYKGKIYYRAYKEIKKGIELLVWYGCQYAEQLGITKEKEVISSVDVSPNIPGRTNVYHLFCITLKRF